MWIEAQFGGRAAHGSRPDEGIDAILHAAHFLAASGEMETDLEGGPPHPLLALPSFHAVLEKVRRGIPGLDARLKPGLFRPGTEVPKESILVQTLLVALMAEGLPPTVEGMTVWVDAAFLNESGVPAVCFGPGSIAQAHAGEEWVEIEELEVGARVLSRFVENFLRDPNDPAS